MTVGKNHFFRASTSQEREDINQFLSVHNVRGKGSTNGYVGYYASCVGGKLVAAAKVCPLHTPSAANFFSGRNDGKAVWCLQRLAAFNAPKNTLTRFISFILKDLSKDKRIHYLSTYGCTDTFNQAKGVPHYGAVYQASNALYFGLTKGGRIEGYTWLGDRHSMRKGPKTLRVSDIPDGALVHRSAPKHRYCWPVGTPLKRKYRRLRLLANPNCQAYPKAWQPRLLARLLMQLKKLSESMKGVV